jgi:hypothetical protein
MSFEKRIKKLGNKKLDSIVPNLYTQHKKKNISCWYKILIPSISVCAILAVVLPITLPLLESINYEQIITPTVEKISYNPSTCHMSKSTYDSYKKFSKEFVSLIMETNNQKQVSMGISIPDAYINFATLAATSEGAIKDDIFSLLQLNTYNELKTAVLEILDVAATPYFQTRSGKTFGGLNYNSIWLNPNHLSLAPKNEDLYKDLADVFDLSVFYDVPTTDKVTKYLNDVAINGLQVPKISLNDQNPSAAINMSTYTYMDCFDSEVAKINKSAYLIGKTKMDYFFNDETIVVDYINSVSKRKLYEGYGFLGSYIELEYNDISFFLPDQNKSPRSILEDVLLGNYSPRTYNLNYIENNQEINFETQIHEVTIKAPYFTLENDLVLEKEHLKTILPNIASGGALNKLATLKTGGSLTLEALHQDSIMNFDYDGFYSTSVTYTELIPGAPLEPPYERYELILNRPYVFKIDQHVLIDGKYDIVDGKYDIKKIPLIIGEIVDPHYIPRI